MIDEKQYTQSDINAAICKAITDLQAVNEKLNKIIMRNSQTGNAPNANAVKNYIYECIEHASKAKKIQQDYLAKKKAEQNEL